MMNIALATDHTGFEYKEAIKSRLLFAQPQKAVACGDCQLGIILGGSGNEAIVTNRLKGIWCAVAWNKRTALLSKRAQSSEEHGDCNMIAIGQRMMSQAEAIIIVDLWLTSEFKGDRH